MQEIISFASMVLISILVVVSYPLKSYISSKLALPASQEPMLSGSLRRSRVMSWIFLALMLVFAAVVLADALSANSVGNALMALFLGACMAALGVWYWRGRTKVYVRWDHAGVEGPPIGFSKIPTRIRWDEINRVGNTAQFPSFLADVTGRTISWADCGDQAKLVGELQRRRPDLFGK